MANITVRVAGVDGVRRSMGSRFEGRERRFRETLKNAAMDILADSKVKVPVDTGKLKASLTAIPYQAPVHEPLPWAWTIGTNMGPPKGYATYVEFGTRRMRARPYLRPAFRAGVEQLKRELRRL